MTVRLAEGTPANPVLAALRRLTPALLLRLGPGSLVLAVLGFLWLQIPDSHVWQFAFSMLSGAALLAGFLWLYGNVVSIVRTGLPARLPRTLWLLVFLALGWALTLPIDYGRAHEGLFAGYWTSKLSHGLRYLANYNRLFLWQDRAYDLLLLLLVAVLLPLAVELVATGFSVAALRAAARVYRRWLWWVVTLAFLWAGYALTGALADWAPGNGLHSLGFESSSMLLRLGVAFVADVLLAAFVLGLTAVYLERARTQPAISAAHLP